MESIELLFQFIRSEIFNKPINDKELEQIDEKLLLSLYNVSKAHDLSHIVGNVLANNKLLKDNNISTKLQQKTFMAVYRYETINYTLTQISDIFEENHICFVPLKGSIIRELYPKPWMRTSCDIDILIHEEDLERAITVLVEKAGFTQKGGKNYHDVSLFSPNKVHLELHFSILEMQDNIDKLLAKVWDYCIPTDDASYRYEMTKEYFVFHHLSHMSYHFLHGGCGVRPFIDLKLLNDKLNYDVQKVKELCAECNIERFYECATLLSDVWFGNAEHTSATLRMQEFILSGGVYGSQKNHISVKSKRSGGRFGYILKRIFMPYSEMKHKYPILNKCGILLPFCHILRWFEIIFKRRVKKSLSEIKAIKNSNPDDSRDVTQMLSELGL